MAINSPKATTGAPPVTGGWTAQEELSCRARNGGSAGRGRKLRRRCCAEAVEAKTSFGQINPSPEAVGRGLEQTIHGDQGDPEGSSGKTGQAPPAMKPPKAPVRPSCASPLPCCLAVTAAPPGQVCQHDGSAKDDIRTSAATGPKCRSNMAETPSHPAQLDDDPTVRPLPSFPAPIPAASIIAWQRYLETRGRDSRTRA